MQRTYKSKKDGGGGLDRRDMVLTMDEKSSAFDAFYIQNIKQTKREQSSIGSSNQYNVAPNRVRKRKYVRRIIKDATPPPKASLSESVFLTPDKSIHVKKAPDLFDLLLESSPAWKVQPKEAKAADLFDKLRTTQESKTYTRKKTIKKKINYSSTDSFESDEENTKSNNNTSQNTTDIGAHELIIEKEVTSGPKCDDSINKIVKNISLLNNLHRQTSNGSFKKTYRNRLTNNFNSPLVKTSPLSSTPFTDKMRSKSIYEFSPIPMGDLEDSPKYVTVMKENEPNDNDSIILISKDNNNKSKLLSKVDLLTTHLTDNVSNVKKHIKPLFSSEDTNSKSSVENSCTINGLSDEIKISSLETSEVKPFMGFSENTIAKTADEIITFDKDDSIILPSTKISKSKQKSRNCSNIKNNQCSKDRSYISNNFSVEYSMPVQPFLGFSKVDVDNNTIMVSSSNAQSGGSQEIYKNNHLEDEENNASSVKEHTLNSTEKEFDANNEQDTDGVESLSVSLEKDSRSGNSASDSRSIVRESLYNTCNSEQNLEEDSDGVVKEPVVALERMNSSLFKKYYTEMPEYTSSSDDESDSNKSNDDFPSFQNSEDNSDLSGTERNEFAKDIDVDIEIDIEQSVYQLDTPLKSEVDETIHEEEERCISFVTTRRRNDRTNNSTILILNDSCDSNSSSTECDKTVLSNNKIDLENNYSVVNINNVKNESIEVTKTGLENTLTEMNNEKSKNTEANIEARSENSVYENMNSFNEPLSEIEPSIVLQPGKKWERSLSIYRRMTMLNDPVNHSILDEENLHSKGRKYRQSVIHTMEMQDKGTLHNESIHSRRSTFVCKPSRSTIRIVKETNNSRLSLSSTTVLEDLKGFLEDCDDTIVELSKLSIAEDHEVTVLEKFHESTRVATARDYVLRRCNQTDAILFDECYPDTVLKNCRKIGEGVYGEVFLWRATDGRARVMKIVPVAGTTRVNGEHQKDFHEIISEIVIAMELSALRAPIAEIECHFDEGKEIDALDLHSLENATDIFNEVLAVRSVYGNYPSRLLDLWELYDECKGSDNDNPAILPVDQQYIVLELANAGQDLESYQFNSAEQAHALFLQVAFGLAVGEEAFQFEHRDLHWGNVLIQPTDQKFATFVLRGRAHRVPRRGVSATIIDYSLSRLSLPLASGQRDCRESAALYNDLSSDDGLFGAVGDYQFEVYRLMREKLGNDWKNFEPYTNVLWLHYTVDKMITALRYKRTTTKTHKQYIAKLKGIKDRILSYGSAAQFVLTDNEY